MDDSIVTTSPRLFAAELTTTELIVECAIATPPIEMSAFVAHVNPFAAAMVNETTVPDTDADSVPVLGVFVKKSTCIY
jgi:hypothetical protein